MGDQILAGANPFPHTAGSAQACVPIALLVIERETARVFVIGHQLPVLPNYSPVFLPAEANQTSENAFLRTVSALGCSLHGPGSSILKLCNHISLLSN